MTSHQEMYEQAVAAMAEDFATGFLIMERAFSEALSAKELKWASHYAWELALLQKNLPDKSLALKWARNAYELDPDSRDAKAVLGSILWEMGSKEEAIPLLEQSSSQGDLLASVMLLIHKNSGVD